VFYKECVVAIGRAAACHEDASAWFEQMERLVEGVDGVAFSYAGVKFLLREMARSEGELLASPQLYRFVVLRSYLARLVHTMPPPLLPRRIRSTRLPTMNARTPANAPKASGPAAPNTPPCSPFVFPAPLTPAFTPSSSPFEAPKMIGRAPVPTGLQNPNRDPMFFTDPSFKRDVNAYWGNPEGSGYITDYGDGPPNPLTDSDRELAALLPRYNPANDDLQIFRQTAARAAAARAKESRLETERSETIKDVKHKRDVLVAMTHLVNEI
jgi:hypothetical protein